MSPYLNCDDDCCAEPHIECLACVLGLSDIGMKALGRFLEENKDALHAYGLSLRAVHDIVEATTV
jgi:predicted transcriptional regulator